VSVPPPPVPGGQPPVGQPDPYGPPPVAQQPAAGAPPEGYGPPPGTPPGYGPQPGVPQQPQPKSKLRLLRILLPILVVVIGGVFAIVSYTKSPDSSKVGDCLSVVEFKQGAEPDKAACDDPSANVRIAVKLDESKGSCPEGMYDEYSVTGSASYKLCLMLNAKQGDCFSNMTSETAGYKKIACTDPTAEAEVLKVVDAPKDQCEGTEANASATYSEPATTVCLKIKEG